MAVFSNEEMLSFFKITDDPAPMKPKEELSTHFPKPGTEKFMRKKRELEIREEEEKQRKERESFIRPSKSSSFENSSVHKRMMRRRQMVNPSGEYNFGEDQVDSDDEADFEEGFDAPFGPGKLTNPSAVPGDDDYEISFDEDLYNKFKFDVDLNPRLPIEDFKDQIIEMIEANPVVLIQGETGSGKSTQVAQYILEHHMNVKRHCNIICTQPRRIAATSIAKYVCRNRDWELGSLVGYQIGMDKMVSEDTRLTFMTTGVLLEKLVNMKNMNQFTHVILDEIHERDKDTDFCMLVVRKLLKTNSKNVKVILMSATVDSFAYTRYFASRTPRGVEPAPAIAVQGRTYRVIDFCLDDIKHVGECHPMEQDDPLITDDVYLLACKLIRYFDTVEQQEPQYSHGDFMRGTVLVFLPGLPEIKNMQDILVNNAHYRNLGFNVLLLHSSISSDEQSKVFLKPELGKRKVILATNIAESSITVPDIKYVIDFCLVKQLMCDWETNFCSLRTMWTSHASLTQRQGRAGRVSNGRCYRLITRQFLRKIPTYSIPEMQRCPLETVVLKAKKLDLGEPKKILSHALQPPNLADIERAILTLKEVGAITVMHHGLVNPYDGNLTLVGRIMESLPVDVKLGKLVVLGHAFGCLESCLVIVAALSLKSFFVTPSYNTMAGYRSKMSWADQPRSFSDCIAVLNAYKAWFEMKNKWKFKPNSRSEELSWCKRNLISLVGINQVAELVKELTARLAKFNIRPFRKLIHRAGQGDLHELLILKVVLCGAFYPNYFRWSSMDEELNQRTMSGHDPTTTVMVSGLPANPEQYAADICRLFSDCGKGKELHFEGQKVFIEFERHHLSHPNTTDVAQPVQEAVYIALKKRHERGRFFLYAKDDRPGQERRSHSSLMGQGAGTREHGAGARGEMSAAELEAIGSGGGEGESESAGVVRALPAASLQDLGTPQIMITEVVSAGNFWAQFSNTSDCMTLRRLQASIERRHLEPLVIDLKKLPGVYCLAMYSMNGHYYRAKVETVKSQTREAKVIFIDYGNVEWVHTDSLCKLSLDDIDLPPQAFECVLAKVKPAYSMMSQGYWSQAAKRRFEELCCNKELIISIYSKVNNILRVDLYDTNTECDILINDVLIDEGFAVKCEEPYQSKLCRARAIASRDAAAHPPRDLQPREKLQNAVVSVNWINSYSDRQQNHSNARKVVLKGPNNPYEVTFYSMTNAGMHRPVRIERTSVNSVVIDNEPQDHHERLMVAAHVQLNPSGNTCIARDTTLLPNIHGLPYLLSMLFAPCIELRSDELKRQYIGVLCGLGSDPSTGESIYHEHDMELAFDTHITNEDIAIINDIRSAVNLVVCADEDRMVEWGEYTVKKIQTSTRERLKQLILKPRDGVKDYPGSRKHGWNQVDPEDVIMISDPEEELVGGYAPPYPMHAGINISGARIDKMRSTEVLLLREKMKKLRTQASDSTETKFIVCELCNIQVTSPFELQQHLGSSSHRGNKERLFSDDLELDKALEERESKKLTT